MRPLLLAVLPLAAILLVPTGCKPAPPAKLPVLPAVATTPGEYFLDATRYVEIESDSGSLRLLEGTQSSSSSKLPEIVTYTAKEIITLHPGWSVGLRPPDILVINDGSGKTITRNFGDPSPGSTTSSITRSPSAPSSAMRAVISSTPGYDPVPIPVSEVETPTEDPDTEDKGE